MKKFFSLLLAVLMVVGMFPTAAFAADGPSITATANKTAAEIGDTIEVTFTLANNPGFNNASLILDFDHNVLQFTGLKINEDTEAYEGRFASGLTEINTIVGHEKYGTVLNTRSTITSTDGKLFVAQFTVIGAGNTAVGVTVNALQDVADDSSVTDHTGSVAVTPSAEIAVAGIPATSVTLDKNELTLEEGKNHILTVTVDPDNTTDKVTFKSDNEEVATVSSAGNIKAIKVGKATITVTAGDVSATCVVTVEKEESIVHKSPDGYTGYTATAEMTGVKSLVVGGSTKTVKNIYKLPLIGHEGAWVHMDGAGTGQGAAYKLDGTAVFGVPNGVDLTKFSINGTYASANTADLLVTKEELTEAVGEANVSKLVLSEDKLYAFLYTEDPWKNRNCGILFEITPVAVTGVEVQETMSLYEGESGNLSVSVLPASNTDDLTVTYSSDSEAVATVDANGKVTAVAPGTAVITITAGSFTDTCTVTVKKGYTEIENIPGNGDTWKGSVTGIAIKNVTVESYSWNGKTLNVYITDDTATATVIFNFNHNGYDNKFEETADITNGSGTLTETFNYNDGWESYDITWTVNFVKSVPATSLEIDKTELTMYPGDSETITATLSEGTTDVVTWSSSAESIATVDKTGKVTAVGVGNATITASVRNLTKTCSVTVKGYAVENIPAFTCEGSDSMAISSLLILGADVESAAWEGDTLTVTLPEGTADGTEIKTKWTVEAKNPGGDFSDYSLNGEDSFTEGSSATVSHDLSASLSEGKATITAAFGLCSEEDPSYDVSFTPKTYTINFTVAGGNEPEHECSFVKEVAEEKYLASEADCENAATYYKSCECGKASETDTFKSGEKLGHEWGSESFTWSVDKTSCTATHSCKRDASHKETATTTDISTQVIQEATCEKAEMTVYSATFTESWAGETIIPGVVTAPALDHDWSEATYNFAEDGKSCTATRQCKRTNCDTDGGKIETATATITSAVKTPAECGVKGTTRYTATFTEDWAETQTKDVQDIPALQHVWKAPTYNFAEDGKSCTATRECERNAQHVETAQASISSAVTKEPNCSEKGETTYTATFSEDWAATQTKTVKDIAVDPDNHTFGAAQYTWTDNGTKCTASRRCINTADGDRCNETETAEGTMTSEVTTPATCTVKGWTTYTATFTVDWAETKTNSVQDVAIDEDAHKYDAGKITTPATCSKEGVKTFTCEYNAQHTYTEKVAIDPDAHDWKGADGVTNVTTTKAPTCTEKGERKFTCEHNAEHFYTEEIDALGHEMGEWEVVEKATYTKKGLMERKCVREGCTYKETKDIPKLVADEDDEIRGVTIITPGEKIEEEENPNTGAPVVGIAPFAVLAAAAVVSKFRRK